MSNKSKRYTKEFKMQIVELVNNGKSPVEIVKEYNIARSTVSKWVKDYNNSGSFKASGADNGTKVAIIKANKDKYSISAMCEVLKIHRSLVYYTPTEKPCDSRLENEIITIFKKSRNNYGTRKIKKELDKKKYQVSRKKIGRIMKKYGLVSNYTVKQYKVHKSKYNEEKIDNIVNRKFDRKETLEVVVSDLTYVNVKGKWNYICILLDLYNREIIGYAAGKNKDATLVYKAFTKINRPLKDIKILHTDRGNEFKNNVIDGLLSTFNIKRSLSNKGCPYDNAVAEAAFKVIKTEFVFNKTFESFEELEYLLFDYVNWYNNHRIHGSLNYLTPVEYRILMSDKKVS